MTSKSKRRALPMIIAHRGNRKEAPENTFAAFDRAMALPIDGIEFDVQMTKDGVPVVCHDPTLNRYVRSRRRISSCSFEELAALDWGSWFDGRFAGEPLPTLKQALEKMGPHIRLLVEIKADVFEQRTGRAFELARAVANMLDSAYTGGLLREVLVLCFYPEILEIVHRQAPQLSCVLNVTRKHMDLVMAAPSSVTSHLWGVDVDIEGLSATWVQWARQRRLRVFTYTCNTPFQVARALDLGVDGIITDRPGWLAGFFDRQPAPLTGA